MAKRFRLLLTALFLFSIPCFSFFPILAQGRRNNDSRFYDGASRGIHGGNYGQGNYHGHDHYRNDQGGIGPGKGALIGGAAGAVLGAAFGGGVKGSLIAGAAGAGIGAVIGQSAQNSRDSNDYYRR